MWNICDATREHVLSDMCAQGRLKSACASAQSDQNLRYFSSLVIQNARMRRLPNLRWVHVSDGTFSDVAAHLVKQRPLWINHGPLVQSIVSLTSALVVKTLTILISTTSNLQVFCWKNMSNLCKCYSHFFSKNISVYMYARFYDQSFYDWSRYR